MNPIKILAASAVLFLAFAGMRGADLVILHTNDTHSAIDPDTKGRGGVLQRKAIIDSVRAKEKNVLLLDAGDAVQGTLFFKFFKGDVEYPLLDMAGYDAVIVGNHEFDNGMDELASHYGKLKVKKLSANYDFSDTPLKGMFAPYLVKKYGKHKVGIIGLNIDPTSLISKDNYNGLVFKDVVETANRTAEFLKNKEKCDLIVALTHIGANRDNAKENDYDLAAQSKDIDVIIGGHSHTLIPAGNADPSHPSMVTNAAGRPVLVVQTGKNGHYLGYIKVDLEELAELRGEDADEWRDDFDEVYRQEYIPVTDRFDASVLDARMAAHIAPFREKLRETTGRTVAMSAGEMSSSARTGAYVNWVADFAKWYGDLKADSLAAAGVNLRTAPDSLNLSKSETSLHQGVDFAMMNVGGIRQDMRGGVVTEGDVLSTFPFANRVVLLRIKGADFIEAMKIAAAKGGEAISDELRVLTDGNGNLLEVLLDNEPMNPEHYYLMATIDYLAGGNDDFIPLAKGEEVWRDVPEMSAAMLRYLRRLTELGLPVYGDPRSRFIKKVQIRL